MTAPGVGFPQLSELMGMVHPLSEYTLKFADVYTVPVAGTFVDVFRAA